MIEINLLRHHAELVQSKEIEPQVKHIVEIGCGYEPEVNFEQVHDDPNKYTLIEPGIREEPTLKRTLNRLFRDASNVTISDTDLSNTGLPSDSVDEVRMRNVFGDPRISSNNGTTLDLRNNALMCSGLEEIARILTTEGTCVITENLTPDVSLELFKIEGKDTTETDILLDPFGLMVASFTGGSGQFVLILKKK